VTTNGGSANKLSSSSGAALNVNATTIGASGLTFESINSTGSSASNGITLDHTGSLASLTITGTGSAGSGGTIANKSSSDGSATQGSGIYLDNVVGVSLTRMQLNDFANYAIRGINVTGFSLSNSVISGINGSTEFAGGEEGAMRFDGLFTSASFPTAIIANSTIGGGYSENIRVKNSNGTLNRLVVDNVTLSALGDNATHGGDAFLFEGLSGSTMNLTLSNSTINGARGDLVNAVGRGGGAMDVVLRQNRFYNLDVNTVSSGGGVTLAGGDNGSAAFTFDVSCNRFKGTLGSSLNIFKSPSSTNGIFTGTVGTNLIGVLGTPYSAGSSSSPALWIQSHGSGKIVAMITNNTIYEYGEEAINLQATQGSSAGIDAFLLSNAVLPSAFATAGVSVEAGAISGDGGTINIALGSSAGLGMNSLSAGDPSDAHDVLITKALSASTGFNLYLNGVSNGSVASVIQASNNGTTSVSVNSAFTNSTTSISPQTPASVSSCSVPSPLMADVSHGDEAHVVQSVTDDELAAVAAEAISRIKRASPSADVAHMKNVSFTVATLPERQLAEATARRILVAPTAAGWGWFVDTTPSDDAEFEDVVNAISGEHELRARRGGAADGRMDLLTTLMHELEHTLGHRDLDPASARNDVMSATLAAGTRRTPQRARTSQGASHE
jgi:hypothetical protein